MSIWRANPPLTNPKLWCSALVVLIAFAISEAWAGHAWLSLLLGALSGIYFERADTHFTGIRIAADKLVENMEMIP